MSFFILSNINGSKYAYVLPSPVPASMIDKLSLCISDCIICIILNCESLNSHFESEYREPSLPAISSSDGIEDFLFDLYL